ncbi:MAG: hypothetical protein WAN60_07145 [Candidatus Sulfotelmatobacter sp.]
MKRIIFCIAFLSLLAICLTSCGAAYNLRTIQLTAPSTVLQGIGGTIQLQAEGTYSYGANKDLTNLVTYTIIVDPVNGVDINGVALPTPPSTAMVSPTGLVTAVDPPVCTFADVGTATTPAWVLTGTYEITATYRGVTSQPVYIGVASAAGPPAAPASGQCGPSATSN